LVEDEFALDIRESKTDRMKASCRASMDGDIDIAGHSITKSQSAGRATGRWSRRVAASAQQRDREQKYGKDKLWLSHD
jgi:hypothetical protein